MFFNSIRLFVCLGLGVPLLLPNVAFAGLVASGFNTTTLPRADDFLTGAISIGFTVDFFGTTYTSLYLSDNGFITFGGSQTGALYNWANGSGSTYIGRPVIAGFGADTDTRGSGSGLIGFGIGTYAGRSAIGFTFDHVGYYNQGTDRLNTWQLILTDRSDTGAGNFDLYYNYNQIQWETGGASGSGGLGGYAPTVGYNAGLNTGSGSPVGTYYSFPGSQQNGTLIDGGANALSAGSNDGVTGQYLFQMRAAAVVTPEPESFALLGTAVGGFAISRLRRRKVH